MFISSNFRLKFLKVYTHMILYVFQFKKSIKFNVLYLINRNLVYSYDFFNEINKENNETNKILN